MDIVDFWAQQIEKWNSQAKCGFCWEFAAPLVPSQINIVLSEPMPAHPIVIDDNCCVKVFLTDLRFREIIVRNSVTSLITSKTCVWNFSVYALMQKQLGINNYNEIKGHPIEQSKWVTVFKPLIDCLGCENILDTCEILGITSVNVEMPSDAQLIHNYLDNNYNGWKVNYTFTQVT